MIATTRTIAVATAAPIPISVVLALLFVVSMACDAEEGVLVAAEVVVVVVGAWLEVVVEVLDELVEVGPMNERLAEPAYHVETMTVVVGLAVSTLPVPSSQTPCFSSQQSTSKVLQQ